MAFARPWDAALGLAPALRGRRVLGRPPRSHPGERFPAGTPFGGSSRVCCWCLCAASSAREWSRASAPARSRSWPGARGRDLEGGEVWPAASVSAKQKLLFLSLFTAYQKEVPPASVTVARGGILQARELWSAVPCAVTAFQPPTERGKHPQPASWLCPARSSHERRFSHTPYRQSRGPLTPARGMWKSRKSEM